MHADRMNIEDMLVMLIEPSSMQRKIINNHLNDLGVRDVLTADSAENAMQQMLGSPPDLVISALYLPDKEGTELLHEMRNSDTLTEAAFLLISSETDWRILDPIRQAGSIAILPKPFQVSDLKRALNATVDYYTPDEADLGETYDIEEIQVLVVDDSRMARRHIMRTLNNLGIQNIQEAGNGLEAIDKLSNNFFDLVVTDYNMPEMDGNQLTGHIREHSSQRTIPILMVTSEADEGRLAAVQDAGVSAMCDKPFEPSIVRNLLEGFFAE